MIGSQLLYLLKNNLKFENFSSWDIIILNAYLSIKKNSRNLLTQNLLFKKFNKFHLKE